MKRKLLLLFAIAMLCSTAFSQQVVRIGIIGLDTSHSTAFTELINGGKESWAEGFKIVAAYPYGSRTIESSYKRIPDYIEKVKAHGVKIVDSIDELLKEVDCVLLETNDGNPHLEQAIKDLEHEIRLKKNRIEDVKTARELMKSDITENREKLQEGYLDANTAKMNYNRAKEQREQSEKVFSGLVLETKELEAQQKQIEHDKEQIAGELENADKRQKEIEEENVRLQALLDEQIYLEETATKEFSAIQIDESNFRQKTGFVQENLDRVNGELQ